MDISSLICSFALILGVLLIFGCKLCLVSKALFKSRNYTYADVLKSIALFLIGFMTNKAFVIEIWIWCLFISSMIS